MLVNLSCHQLQSLLNARLVKKTRQDVYVTNISTDTRTLAYGDTFVALKGEHYNAIDYVELAVEKGANAVIVERELPDILVPQLIVSSTRNALRDMAAFQRANFAGKVIAITGSNGKTTTKEMLKSILSIGCEVTATKGNLNNEIGVPLTVFNWTENHDYAIVEMGANHIGEIGYLSHMVAPDVAVITNVSEAHIEGFGSLASTAEAKAEIYDGLKRDKGIAVINVDDAFSEQWFTKTVDYIQLGFARQTKNAVRKYHPNVFAVKANESGYCQIEFDNGEVIEVQLPVNGLHNIDNALAAAALSYSLGINLDVIAQGLATFEPASGRLQSEKLPNSSITIIDDTYNANPASLRAGVDVLQLTKHAKRILVMGDMGELGENADEIHFSLGEELATRLDAIFCIGTLSQYLAMGAKKVNPSIAVEHVDSKLLLMEILMSYLADKSSKFIILVKGSRRAKMEQIVHALKHAYSTDNTRA